MNSRLTLDSVAAVAMTVASCVMVWSLLKPDAGSGPALERTVPPLPTEPVPLEGAVTKGRPEAPVAILEFSDFQCPYCATFATNILPELDREFVQTGQVAFALRHLPLESIHPQAKAAAAAAVCAGQQGRFWEVHDALFRNPRNLQAIIADVAVTTDVLDPAVHSACMPEFGAKAIEADARLARTLGVKGTPTFFIGTRTADNALLAMARLDGASSLDTFRQTI